jgi:Loader and inhibitor of phage G40P
MWKENDMNLKETKTMLQKAQVHYWKQFQEMPEEYMGITVKEWARLLKTYDVMDISLALDEHIKRSPFKPTVSDLIEGVKNLQGARARQISINAPKLTEGPSVPMPNEIKQKLKALGWWK